MLGQALKGLGVVIVVSACIGVLAGATMFLFGVQSESAPESRLLGSDAQAAPAAPPASERGTALVGTSLIAAGVGLAILVAGIVVGGRQQTQQGTILVSPATNLKPPTIRN